MRLRVCAAVCWLLSVPAGAETFVWVDVSGVTHITDDRSVVPPDSLEGAGARARNLGGLWDHVDGPKGERAASVGGTTGRDERLVHGAVADMERGERGRAAAALESVLRTSPANAKAHWYLAELDRHRGRFDSSETHLRFFLASAGDDLQPWRVQAERRLEVLSDERHLADESIERGPGSFVDLDSPHFRVSFDSELGRASPHYSEIVVGFLERARIRVGERLGVTPEEPMGVVLYGKAAYLRAHRHRFSFQTVGFFDGRIHVVSAAHPERELRDLLFHEYTHAMFREQTGGDRPFWLNEGLAELSEREDLSHDGLTRSERVSLHNRIDEGSWIPLRRLAPSFSGLDNSDARVAYLEATAAAAWIDAHTDRAARRRLLMRLGNGASSDRALVEAVGLDTDGIDRAVREAIRSEFPVFSSD